LINREIIKLGSDAPASMIQVNGIQANLSNPLLSIEGETHEADNAIVDQLT